VKKLTCCHSERSEESLISHVKPGEISRFARNDSV
jgi:hypothetical protein